MYCLFYNWFGQRSNWVICTLEILPTKLKSTGVDVQTPPFGDLIRYCAMVWASVAFSTVLFRSVTYIATASLRQRNALFAKKEKKKFFTKVRAGRLP
jgi:hypothetical protein